MTTRSRLTLLTVGSVAITALVFLTVGYYEYRSLVREERRQQLSWEVEVEAARLQTALQEVQNDALLIARLPAAQAATSNASTAQTRGPRNDLAEVFAEVLRAKRHYRQVRVLELKTGQELVRVDRTASGVVRVPETGLQKKANRQYFREARELAPDQAYLSSVDLNREYGKITEPWEPMIRVATPIRGASGVQAVAVINLRFDLLLESLLESHPAQYIYYVANEDGGYVRHRDPDKQFGFEFGRPARLQDDFPELAAVVDGEVIEGLFLRSNRVVVARRVSLGLAPHARHLILAVETDPNAIHTQVSTVFGTLGLWIIGLAVVGGVLAIRVARRITRPLSQIALAAQQIERGHSAPLPTDRSDEVGSLARALDAMLGSLRAKEQALLKSQEDLIGKNEDLRHFTHLASHDLREPVGRMAVTADILRSTLAQELSDEDRELLEFMVTSAQRANDLIIGFRILAGIGDGKVTRSAVDVDAIVRDIVADHGEELATKGVDVQIGSLPTVSANPTLTRIVFDNLVRNAADHSSGNNVMLRISATRESEEWLFVVANTGAEMNAKQLRQAFQPFVKGSGNSDGTGLGLSICQRAVERQGGRIAIESDSGRIRVLFTLGSGPDGEIHADK